MKQETIPQSTFSAYEGPYQAWFRKWRDTFFTPLLRLLTQLGVHAWMITLFGILAVLLALFFSQSPLLALAFLLLQLFFDGLDGPLSRYRRESSRFGEFLDVFGDHISLLSALGIFVLGGFVSLDLALFYGAIYTLLLLLAYLRNQIGHPYVFLIRPRLLLYLSYFFDAQNITTGATQWLCLVTLPLVLIQSGTGLLAVVDNFTLFKKSDQKYD